MKPRIFLVGLMLALAVLVWRASAQLKPVNAPSATISGSITGAYSFAAGIVTVDATNVYLVPGISNLMANLPVTNENSTALQINTGVLSLSPGVVSNIVASGFGSPYIAISTNSGTLNNVTSLVFRTLNVVVSNDAAGIASIHVIPPDAITNNDTRTSIALRGGAVSLFGTNGTAPTLSLYEYGNTSPIFYSLNANGTEASPTAMSSGNVIGIWELLGYGTTLYQTAFSIRPAAAAAFSDSVGSTLVRFGVGDAVGSSSGRAVAYWGAYVATNLVDVYFPSNVFAGNGITYQVGGATLVGTNLWLTGTVAQVSTNYLAANSSGVGVTNFLLSDLPEGKYYRHYFWASNGTIVNFPQFTTASMYVPDGAVVTPNTNCMSYVEFFRFGTQTNITVVTAGFDVTFGNGVEANTNFVTRKITLQYNVRTTNYPTGALTVNCATDVRAQITNAVASNYAITLATPVIGTAGSISMKSDGSARTLAILCAACPITFMSTNDMATSTNILTAANKRYTFVWRVDMGTDGVSTNISCWGKSQTP
jgi:hypothetical protein